MKKDLTVVLVIIAFFILFLVFGCSIIALLVYSPGNDSENGNGNDLAGQGGGTADTTPPGGETPEQVNYSSLNLSQGEIAIWQNLNKANVERACLAKAKEQAGANAGLVYGCSCVESSTAQRKVYGCEISTADIFTKYFLNADCFLDAKTCTVTTNYGTQTVTFDQLAEWSK